MPKLMISLQESDSAVRATIARFWGVEIGGLDTYEATRALHDAMLDSENAARIWDMLDDAQRGTLQTVIGANESRMPALMFERLHGEIRKMGRGAIERENPLQNPASVAEALFYRGLIYEIFEQSPTGPRAVVYVPPDLVDVLPFHKTGYDDLEPLPDTYESDMELNVEPVEADLIEEVVPADTTIVDDVATILGYFQVRGGEVEDETLSEIDMAALVALLIQPSERRLMFLFEIMLSMPLIEVQEGLVRPRRAEAKRWLEARRAEQLRELSSAWARSTVFRELWHVPGLYPDPTGWPYDPVVAREALLGFLRELTPQGEWWSIDDFISVVKVVEPDFQRPGGDYDSWYIRNEAGEYLNGFESWEAVEGALLEFYLMGPMHWLGLVDLAEDAARLNAYGRAFVNRTPWPTPQEMEARIEVQPDGTLTASRHVSRMDRFQAMRFTTWGAPARDGEPYTYRISMEGVKQAAEQGINVGHIDAFLTRMMGVDTLPPALNRLLETWQQGPQTSVTLEAVTILRTTAPETLDFIMETPALRRFCGARLGPMAVIVRADQREALQAALEERGIQMERRV